MADASPRRAAAALAAVLAAAVIGAASVASQGATGTERVAWAAAAALVALAGVAAASLALVPEFDAAAPADPERALPTRSEAAFILLALAGIAAFWGTAEALVEGDGVTRWDEPAAELARRATTPGILDMAAGLSLLGSAFVVVPLVALAATALELRGHHRTAIAVVVVPAATQIIVGALKVIFARPRPDIAHVAEATAAFPSGHAAMAAALATLATWFAVRGLRSGLLAGALAAAAAAWAVLMALARLALGVHHLTDVFAGAGLGAAVAGLGVAGPRVAVRARAMLRVARREARRLRS